MAVPETASMAIIIAGGVNAGRVDGDAVPRSRAGAATVLGSALRWPSLFRRSLCELGLTSNPGLETDADR
jgi:hypothetical protein